MERPGTSTPTSDAPNAVDLPMEHLPAAEPENANRDLSTQSLEEYHRALDKLKQSLTRMKLHLPDDPLVSESRGDGNTSQLKVPVERSVLDEPTLPDVEIEQQVSASLLAAEEQVPEETYYTTLNKHLKRLLDEEKSSKTPNTKHLLELSVLSDYNILRESLRLQGCTSPSTVASGRIAGCKVLKAVKQKCRIEDSWYARQIRAKATHVIRFGALPSNAQGKGATHHSLLSNEDVRQSILAYIRCLDVGRVSRLPVF